MHILLTVLTSVLRKFSITKLVLYLGLSFLKKSIDISFCRTLLLGLICGLGSCQGRAEQLDIVVGERQQDVL